MKRIILTILALAIVVAGVARADRFAPAKGSFVRIEGTSTLHNWKMEGALIQGQINATPPAQWNGQGQNSPVAGEVSVAIPVTSIKSEHAKMDKLMAEALKASANPVIRYELTSAILANPGPTFLLSTKGKLTIAGVTRDVEMQVTGSRDAAGAYFLTGQLPIRMTDYGIKPPTAMMGTIKTGNDVKVTFRWAVAAAATETAKN